MRLWATLAVPRLGILAAVALIRWALVLLVDTWVHSAVLVGVVHGALTLSDAAALPTASARGGGVDLEGIRKPDIETSRTREGILSSRASHASPVGPLLNIGEMYRRTHGRGLLPPSYCAPMLHRNDALAGKYRSLGIGSWRDSNTEAFDVSAHAPTPKSTRGSWSNRSNSGAEASAGQSFQGIPDEKIQSMGAHTQGMLPGIAASGMKRSFSEMHLTGAGRPILSPALADQ